MTYLEVVQEVMLSVEDTKTTLIRELKKLNSISEKKLVYKELNRPFSELENEYIKPVLYTLDDDTDIYTLHYNYRKGKDDKYILEAESPDELFRLATWEWLRRKKDELATIRPEKESYKTIKVYITKDQKEEKLTKLYDYLIDNKYIIECPKEKFLSLFGEESLLEQPKIKWLKGISMYHYFFCFLEVYGYTHIKDENISSILFNGEFFVNALENDKRFVKIKNRKADFMKKVAYYKKDNEESSIEETKDIKDITDLEDFIKNL